MKAPAHRAPGPFLFRAAPSLAAAGVARATAAAATASAFVANLVGHTAGITACQFLSHSNHLPLERRQERQVPTLASCGEAKWFDVRPVLHALVSVGWKEATSRAIAYGKFLMPAIGVR